MNPKTNTHFLTILVLLAILSGVFSGCTPSQVTAPTSTPLTNVLSTNLNTPTATPKPIPSITLGTGDFYFSIDGQQSFIFSRNVAGYETSHFHQLLDLTSTGGSIMYVFILMTWAWDF